MQRQLALFLFLTAVLCSCAPLKPLELKKNESAKLLNYTSTSAEVEAYLVIKNPNRQSVKISAADLNLKLSGKDVGKGSLKNTVKIKGNSEQSYRFVIVGKLDIMNAGGIASLMDIFSSRSLRLGVEGTITGKKFLLHKKFPISETMNIPLSK